MGVTNSQITQLMTEAERAGDDMQVCICTIALEGPVASFEDRFGGGGLDLTSAQRSRIAKMSQADAAAECERVIAYAAARAEDDA